MENKKIIVLIVLGIAAVISLIYGIVTPPKSRRAGKADTVVHRPKTGQRQVQTSKVHAAIRRSKKTEHTTWKRNPFAPKKIPVEVALPELTLHGIVWHGGEPRAMINEDIVGVGATICGRKVVKIEHDKVIVTDGTKESVLKIEP